MLSWEVENSQGPVQGERRPIVRPRRLLRRGAKGAQPEAAACSARVAYLGREPAPRPPPHASVMDVYAAVVDFWSIFSNSIASLDVIFHC